MTKPTLHSQLADAEGRLARLRREIATCPRATLETRGALLAKAEAAIRAEIAEINKRIVASAYAPASTAKRPTEAELIARYAPIDAGMRRDRHGRILLTRMLRS